MEVIQVHYLSASVLPSRTANSLHVMKMCRALGADGKAVTLHAFGDARISDEEIYEFYGVTPHFAIKRYLGRNTLLVNRINSVKMGLVAASAADVVVARNLLAAQFACASGVKTIYEAHTPISDNPLARASFRWMIRQRPFERLVVITRALASWYSEHFPFLKASGKIQVLPDAADPMPTQVSPWPLANLGERLQVGYLGHLYAGKGMELVSALAELCPWADFSVVGGMDEDVRIWKQRLEHVPNIAFYGHHPHIEAARFLAAFDVVLLPNQRVVRAARVSKSGRRKLDIAQWTSPLKMFEYMASGKPIIASDLPVLREVLRSGENAILCAPEDVKAWGDALRRLLEEPELRNKIGRVALREFEANYTWDRRAELLMAPYNA